jgi:post-segregation antitoxin (ccd killing protein)
MKRFAVLSLPLVLCLTACPKDKPARDTVAVVPVATPVDTAPTDLSAVATALPPVAPDTFKVRKLPSVKPVAHAPAGPSYPSAPSALLEAVQREQAFSRFCYTEFGQKSDPSLSGGVAMLVTVSSSGIDEARVANDNWSSSAGSAVNKCLNEKAHLAWKLESGAVKPGKYVVPLSFRGS